MEDYKLECDQYTLGEKFMRAIEFIPEGIHKDVVADPNDPELDEGLRVDVPNEEWLQDAIDYAKSKSPDRNGLPYMGKTTASVRNVDVPLSILRRIPGMRQEQSKIRHHDLAAIRKIMSTLVNYHYMDILDKNINLLLM